MIFDEFVEILRTLDHPRKTLEDLLEYDEQCLSILEANIGEMEPISWLQAPSLINLLNDIDSKKKVIQLIYNSNKATITSIELRQIIEGFAKCARLSVLVILKNRIIDPLCAFDVWGMSWLFSHDHAEGALTILLAFMEVEEIALLASYVEKAIEHYS